VSLDRNGSTRLHASNRAEPMYENYIYASERKREGEKQIVHVSSFLSCPLLFLPNPVLPIPEFDYPLFPTPCYLLAANNWYQISRSLGFFSSDLIL
jgi:hypothetical protein